MENNEKKQWIVDDEKGYFIDPNFGNDNVQVENLSIEVDLSVFDRPRSFIKVSESNTDQANKKTIGRMEGGSSSFNQGKKFGENNYSFTTSYTEVSDINYDGRETLGITSVEIEFNSSYMPIINIELVDVRGKLFQQGKDSPYGAFFNFPYPMFELKVKGFYGKPVTYLLHLTKFNTKLDSGTGNFKINCNFIGYTYAYLSDMLIGYLKAIPHTEIGQKILKTLDPGFVTFEQLYEYSHILQRKISKVKDGNEVKALARAYEVLNVYQNILNQIDNQLKTIDSIGYELNYTDNKIVFIKKEDSAKINVLSELITNIKEEIIELNETTITGDSYDLDPTLFKLENKTEYFSGLKREHFIDVEGRVLDSYGGSTFYKFSDADFKYIASKMQFKDDIDNGFTVVYLKNMVDEILKKSEALNKTINGKQSGFAENNLDALTTITIEDSVGNELEFDFNIYNYVKVLSDHVDLLMRCIEDVALSAEGDPIRNENLLKDADKLYDIRNVEELGKVYAYPDYKTKPGNPKNKEDNYKTSVFTDTWIGKEHPNIHEAVFVRDLFRGFIESKKLDNQWMDVLDVEGETQWFAINPFDTGNYTGYDNPWTTAVKGESAPARIIRLMTLRALIYLNVSVRNPQNGEIIAMAKLEANNVFNQIENKKVKKLIAMYGDTTIHKGIVDAIRKQIEGGDKVFENDLFPINKKAIVAPDEKNLEGIGDWKFGVEKPTPFEDYIYIRGHETITTVEELYTEDGPVAGIRSFLPLYFPGNKDEFSGNMIISNGSRLKTNEERINLRENNVIFFSDYLGPVAKENNKPDDGATFIDFKSLEEYSKPINTPSYGGEILKGSKVDYTKVWTHDELKDVKNNIKNVSYNGHWNNLEFFNYAHNDKLLPFHNFFYKDETATTTIPKLKTAFYGGNSTKDSPYNLYYLFGTNFYYQQNKFGRALLFLHSLPFKIISGELFNDKIRPLFENKAASIQVPYSWVLLIGGQLYRRYNEKEIWVGDKNGMNILPESNSGCKIPPIEYGMDMGNITGPVAFTGVMGFGNRPTEFDVVLEKLPESVKNKFIEVFKNWVEADNGFALIQDYLEIFENEEGKDTPNLNKVVELFVANTKYIGAISTSLSTKEVPLDSPLFKDKVSQTYANIRTFDNNGGRATNKINKKLENGNSLNSIIPDIMNKDGNVFNFHPTIDENKPGAEIIMGFLNESIVIVNGTWRIWVKDESVLPWVNVGGNVATIEGSSHTFSTKFDNLNTYVETFIGEFLKLIKDEEVEEFSIQGEIFNNTNLEEVYLSIYKNIKSIYDKWITGRGEKMVSFDNLIDTFKFIDRGYNDIGREFKLNPEHITALLNSSYNNSFYSHISKVLSNNNFDFFPLPNYVDLTNKSEMMNLFTPYDYNAGVKSTESSFVCMYIGEKSNRLEGNDDFVDDSFHILDPKGLPEDFNKVPGILVNYGDENQSIFTSIELDQTEFSETNESLLVTDQIANSYNSINTVGQNLFDVYNNRAYNSTIGMLGNAMMQPFMYYGLNNIPMFRGTYVVVNVSHSIQPNHMTTTIKGNRVKRVKTQLIDREAIFYNLIGSFGDIKTSEGNLDELKNIPSSGKTSTKQKDEGPLPIITRDTTMVDIYNNSFYPYKGFKSNVFEKPSNTKTKDGKFLTFNEIFIEVSKLSGVPVLTLQVMSAMESAGGQNKGQGDGINSSGYVGVMQMGYGATIEAIKNGFETKFATIADKYNFFAKIDSVNKKLLLAPLRPNSSTYWVKGLSENTKQNNSMFDDFINVLGGAYYVISNGNKPYTNILNVYLSHQQGPGGFRDMVRNPNEPISKNMQGNLSPYLRKANPGNLVKSQFMMSWAGHVEATAYSINNKYECPLAGANKDDLPELAAKWT